MGEFRMPSLGADMESGVLLEWLVQPGTVVHRGDPMAVIDTDKAAVEVESFDDGRVAELLVQPGQRVAVGVPLATFATEAEPARPTVTRLASPPVRHHAAERGVDLQGVIGTGRHGAVTRADVDRAAKTLAGEPEVPRVPKAAPIAGTASAALPVRRASPYARRLATELGVDLERVSPTGADGTVQAADVRAAVLPSEPAQVPLQTGTPAPVEARAPTPEVAPSRRASRGTIAALMSRAKREIPHYYVATTVDMESATSWLRRRNLDLPVSERLVPAAAVLKATAVVLHDFPQLNGFMVEDHFVPSPEIHLGVAISVRDGALVAPALHRADELDLSAVMSTLRDLVRRARSGRLTRAELADPTFTVTNLGDQGVEEVIGVIYPPQVALLGVGRIVDRPWAVEGRLGINPVLRLTLSADHRATDGFTGARFLAAVDQLLQHPEVL